jgi:hypothetical protein
VGAVAAVTALLAGLCTAIGVLYLSSRARESKLTDDLIASKNAQIEREKELTNKLLPAVEEGNRILQRLMEQVQQIVRDWTPRRGPHE